MIDPRHRDGWQLLLTWLVVAEVVATIVCALILAARSVL